VQPASFAYTALPGRVLFGQGRLATLKEEVGRLGASRALLVSTSGRRELAELAARLLGPVCVATFDGAAMHTPVNVTEQAMAIVTREGVDVVVALGGGSAIGLAKAIALRTDLPQVAVPTTYAGSEMTSIVGQTRDGAKVTQSSSKVLPEVVIYDVDLTLDMPVALSGTSGINAIAHAVEALYARDRNPVTSLMAAEAIRAMMGALDRIAVNPRDLEARTAAQYGAWLSGTCLGAVGMALHHKLCHTLGGSFGLPHAETHTVILPHALAYNASAVPDVMAVLRQTTGCSDPARALYQLAGRVGAPRGLRDVGMKEADIGEAVSLAMANQYWNPRPLEAGPLRAALMRAWAGEQPSEA
jgi:maleylacetate reductase